MPVDGEDGRPDRLLQLLGDPPVILLIEGADCDCTDIACIVSDLSFPPLTNTEKGDSPSAAGNRELILLRTPPHMRRRPVDTQQHQGGLPHLLSDLGVLLLLPNIRIAILRRSDNAVRVGSPIDGSNDLVVLWKRKIAGVSNVRCVSLAQRSVPRQEYPRQPTRCRGVGGSEPRCC